MLQKLMQTWDKDVSSLTKVPPYIPFNFLFLHISLWHFRRNRVSKTACKQRNVCCFQSWLPLLCWITCRSLQESCWTDKAWLLHPSVSRTMLPLHWIGKHSRSRFLIVFTVEKKTFRVNRTTSLSLLSFYLLMQFSDCMFATTLHVLNMKTKSFAKKRRVQRRCYKKNETRQTLNSLLTSSSSKFFLFFVDLRGSAAVFTCKNSRRLNKCSDGSEFTL